MPAPVAGAFGLGMARDPAIRRVTQSSQRHTRFDRFDYLDGDGCGALAGSAGVFGSGPMIFTLVHR